MSSPINAVVTGSFTTPATLVPVAISLPSGFTTIKIVNETDVVTPAATIIEARGYAGNPAGSARVSTGSGANPNVLTDTMLITAGFTFISDSGLLPLGPLVVNAAGGITNAAPPVVTSGTLYPVGSIIRLFNTTSALQLSGMDYEVTVSGAGTMTLGMVATAPGSAATANSLRFVAPSTRFYPQSRYITGIVASTIDATQACIALSVTHGFTVGQQVRIVLPAAYGMTQIDNQLVTITAIGEAFGGAGTTNTIRVNINIAGFTAFAYPTSAIAAVGVNFPQVVPVGEAATVPFANLLDDATRNVSFRGVVIDPAILVASKVYSWIATKGLSV